MWIHPINSESLGRNRLQTRNQIGIPCVSVNIGIGMYWLPERQEDRIPIRVIVAAQRTLAAALDSIKQSASV
jgi:hypothetical protein